MSFEPLRNILNRCLPDATKRLRRRSLVKHRNQFTPLAFKVGRHAATGQAPIARKIDLSLLETFLSGAVKVLPGLKDRNIAVALIELEKV